jgi:hypothetical protein
LVVLLTKAVLEHRHLVSVATQPPRLALVVQGTAQSKGFNEGCQTKDAISRGRVGLTWEGILASNEGRGGCGSSGAEKGECNGGETHYGCDKVKESGLKVEGGEAKLE